MIAGEIIELFRSEMSALSLELLRDDELYRYLDDAYRMFVRLIGGVPDAGSSITEVDIVAGESEASIHPSILRIMRADRRSNGRELQVINQTDLATLRSTDYGVSKAISMNTEGDVMYMMIGHKPNTVRWIQIPVENDTVDMMVYRLPLSKITGESSRLSDIDEQHHTALLDRMKYHAFKRPGTPFFNPKLSADFDLSFQNYCAQAKREQDRFKFKTRTVAYADGWS